jgi:hypothetical protein
MPTAAIILNIALAIAVFATVIGIMVWGIATQHRDPGIAWGGWARRPRPTPARPLYTGVPDGSEA